MNPMELPHNPAREKDIFLAALEVDDPEERVCFVTEACGADEKLLESVLSLLDLTDSEAGASLEPEAFGGLGEARDQLTGDLLKEDESVAALGQRVRCVGDYELIEELGRGAAGVVFRARQRGLNREVALKVLNGMSLASEAEQERFHVEAMAAASLDHPNIVPVHEVGRHEDLHFLSMGLISGGTMAQRLDKGAVPAREAVKLMIKVASAVQAAHRQGVIHRDLKPDNILLDADGEPYITDFGLACRLEQESTLTLTGQIMGTPQYMAPEQADASGPKVTTGVDIYALGAILYQLLSGQPAFRGKSVLQTLQMVKEEIPRDLRFIDATIDRDLSIIVLKCLEKSPSERYSSARELGLELTRWLEGRPIKARASSPVERLVKWARRRPAHAAFVSTMLLFLLTLGVGGPIVAYRQAGLRASADQALAESLAANRRAIEARQLAEEAARQEAKLAEKNRRLAYASNMRLIALSRDQEIPGLMPPTSMLERWFPQAGEIDVRGWEWYYDFGSEFQKTQEIDVGAGVSSLSFSPDSTKVLTGSANGAAIHQVPSTRTIRRLATGSAIRCAFWNPDGASIGLVDGDGALSFWEVMSGREVGRLPDDDEVLWFTWAPRGDSLATLHTGGSIRLWKWDGGGAATPGDRIEVPSKALNRLSWSPDGNSLAGVGDSPEVFVWALDDLGAGPEVGQGHTERIIDLDWHHDGRWLATAGSEGRLRIWEFPGAQRVLNVRATMEGVNGAAGPITAVCWRPEGESLVYSVGTARLLNRLDLSMGKVSSLKSPNHADPHTTGIAWSSDTHSIAMGGAEGVIRFGPVDLPQPVTRVLQHEEMLHSLYWEVDGTELRCASKAGEVFRTNLESGAQKRGFRARTIDRKHTRFAYRSEDILLAALASFDGSTTLEMQGPAELGELPRRILPGVECLNIARGGGDSEVYLVDTTGNLLRLDIAREDDPVTYSRAEPEPLMWARIFPSSDGRRVAVIGSDGLLVVWSMESGDTVFTERRKISDCWTIGEWSPEGDQLAIGTNDGEIHVIPFTPLPPHPQRVVLRGHDDGIIALTWHPTGNRLATAASGSSEIRIWDWSLEQLVLSLSEMEGEPTKMAWDPEGRRLAASSKAGEIVVWDATAGLLLSSSRSESEEK